MTGSGVREPHRVPWGTLGVAVVVLVVAATSPGRAAAGRFLASLRINRPATVSASVAAPAPNATRQVEGLVGAMLADSTHVAMDEADLPAPDADSAGRLAGFAVHLPAARRDTPALTVTGAHAIDVRIDPARLRTILAEAGQASDAVPASLSGASASIRIGRGVEARYGHCPEPVTPTLQSQIVGPPPRATDAGDCVILAERPPAVTDVPSQLDVDQLVGIALQLSGMSPDHASRFQRAFGGREAMALSLPRFMRSWDSVDVGGVQGMLLNTGGRRGPRWTLLWTRRGLVYAMSGYGSSSDAGPLARSIP